MAARIFVVICLLCVTGKVVAEDRFYQIMDATGRIQVIKAPAQSVPAPAVEGDKADAPASVPAQLPATLSTAPAPAPAPAPASPASVAAPYARYDSEQFVDSEALDEAHQKSSRSKFYVLSDPAGTQIQAMSEDGAVLAPVLSSDKAEREFVALKDSAVISSGPEVGAAGRLCFSEKQLDKGDELPAGSLQDVIFDHKLGGFVPPSGLVQVYRVIGEGFGSLRVRSYARKDADPEFVVPRLGFADASGCVTRMTDLYFQRYYSATKSRHPMLEADLVLHAEDVYLVLLTPSGSVAGKQPRPEYRLGSLGRVSVKWQP